MAMNMRYRYKVVLPRNFDIVYSYATPTKVRLTSNIEQWFEEQNITYQTDMQRTPDYDVYSLFFESKEHAVLFKLTWL
jgi:hypothetical protein